MNAFGFQYSDQSSKMELSTAEGQKQEITDMSVRNYHGMFTFNLEHQMHPSDPSFLLAWE